jgi:hypothetical protein
MVVSDGENVFSSICVFQVLTNTQYGNHTYLSLNNKFIDSY